MDFTEKDLLELCDCASSNLERCGCEGDCCVDRVELYRLTLEAILRAFELALGAPPQLPPPGTTCRIPSTCPVGFTGRYTVRPGDSMFTIAQRCGVTLQALINANPHIANPNEIFPCDVLCVPPACAG